MTKDKSIFIRNIYYMLSYAFTDLHQKEPDEVSTEAFENMHNLFAALLAKGISHQLKQGLYREYQSRTESLPVVRGKIDLSGTIQHRLAHERQVRCTYDELSENNQFNQILKTTVMLLLRHGDVSAEFKNDLKKEMLFFANVDTIDPLSVQWSAIRFQRNNRSYRFLISLCQLILEGMLLTTYTGDYRMNAILDEQRMNRLYEKFILNYYMKHLHGIEARAMQIPWMVDDGYRTMLPTMQSDIMLTRKADNTILIIDAKYYKRTVQTYHDVQKLHSANLYQIFTYVKNQEAACGDKPHRVSGMLLYARTEEEIQPDHTYQMSGNQIGVHTLDLNRPFAEIAEQLNQIAQEYFQKGADT